MSKMVVASRVLARPLYERDPVVNAQWAAFLSGEPAFRALTDVIHRHSTSRMVNTLMG
jgi:hypothetical protein